MNNRLTWKQYFMSMTELAAKRSTCRRRQVGAVLVKHKQIIATGYNGAPKGAKHCTDTNTPCMREDLKIPSGQQHELCRAVHAEQNAIIQCATSGVSALNADLFCTTFPCSICAKMLVNAGIRSIVFKEGYPDEMTKRILKDAHISAYKFTGY